MRDVQRLEEGKGDVGFWRAQCWQIQAGKHEAELKCLFDEAGTAAAAKPGPTQPAAKTRPILIIACRGCSHESHTQPHLLLWLSHFVSHELSERSMDGGRY